MKILKILILANDCFSNSLNAHDDIRFTKCQSDHLKERFGIRPPIDQVSSEKIDVTCPSKERGIAGDVIGWEAKWDENFEESNGKFQVPFFFDDSFGTLVPSDIERIREKLKEFESMTCVELVEVDPDDTKFAQKIMITHENTGCWSYVGRWFEYQRVNLADGCQYGTTPLHEFMHALGFWHEQQRGDALNYIDLHRENCNMGDDAFDTNFLLQSWHNSGHEYDFNSIMHYNGYACAWDMFSPVITYKDTNITVEPENEESFSPGDIAQINWMYPCPASNYHKPAEILSAVIGLIPELIYKIWDEISELKPRFNEDKKEILKERWIRRLSKQVNSIFDKDHRPHKYCVNYEHPVTDLSSSTFEIFKDVDVDPLKRLDALEHIQNSGMATIFINCGRPSFTRVITRKRGKVQKLVARIKNAYNKTNNRG